MYRIVASDMDETFIGRDKSVAPANYEAVSAMRAQGCAFVVATGRPFYSVQGTLEALGTAGDPREYTIALNGGYVAANDGTVVAAHPLDAEVARGLLAFARERGLCAHAYLADKTLAMGLNSGEREFLDGRMEVEEVSYDDALAQEAPVFKVLFESTDLDELKEWRDEALKAVPGAAERTEVVFSSERYVEFNPAGVGKGSGLADVARALGVPMSETVAVGDSVNDLSMLEAAGLGLVVSNVSDLLRDVMPASVKVLASSCDDGCMAEVLRDYLDA